MDESEVLEARAGRQFLFDSLQRAFEDLATYRGALPDGISTDTAFAIGEALGVIAKAKALVGRDIDVGKA